MAYLLHGAKTERLTFREIQLSDAADWLPFFEDPKSHQHWKGNYSDPKTECSQWYDYQLARYKNQLGGMNALILKETGQLVGHCGLLVQQVDNIQELEIGYSLLPSFWGLGLATEAARKCRDIAFSEQWSPSLISIISLSNLPSQQVALKNGMRPEKQTHYKGNEVIIYRMHRQDWENLQTSGPAS